MHSDSALLLIGRLYAKVYDQSMDSDAACLLYTSDAADDLLTV